MPRSNQADPLLLSQALRAEALIFTSKHRLTCRPTLPKQQRGQHLQIIQQQNAPLLGEPDVGPCQSSSVPPRQQGQQQPGQQHTRQRCQRQQGRQ